MPLRRARGLLLRFARRRARAVLVGLALAAPSLWLELGGRPEGWGSGATWIDAWWIHGLGLVLGATGIAMIWAGLTGARPDWIETTNGTGR